MPPRSPSQHCLRHTALVFHLNTLSFGSPSTSTDHEHGCAGTIAALPASEGRSYRRCETCAEEKIHPQGEMSLAQDGRLELTRAQRTRAEEKTSLEKPGQLVVATKRTRTSRLLNLPAEIRNEIYKLVVVNPSPILVERTLKPPRLTQVCRQIRLETVGIWLRDNKFRLEMWDCDANLTLKWNDLETSMQDSVRVPRDRQRCTDVSVMQGGPNYLNLKAWLHGRWRRGHEAVPLIQFPPNGTHASKIFFKLAHSLVGCYSDREWVEFDFTIEAIRIMMFPRDPTWLM